MREKREREKSPSARATGVIRSQSSTLGRKRRDCAQSQCSRDYDAGPLVYRSRGHHGPPCKYVFFITFVGQCLLSLLLWTPICGGVQLLVQALFLLCPVYERCTELITTSLVDYWFRWPDLEVNQWGERPNIFIVLGNYYLPKIQLIARKKTVQYFRGVAFSSFCVSTVRHWTMSISHEIPGQNRVYFFCKTCQ